MAKPYKMEKTAYKRAKRKFVTLWKTLGIICLVLTLILAAHGKTTADGMDAEGKADLVYSWDMEFDKETYSKSLNGTAITNQLDHADPNLYYGEDVVTFLSRSDWSGTWRENIELKIIEKMIPELAIDRWTGIGRDFYDFPAEWENMPILNAANGLTLYDMFNTDEDQDGVMAAKDYDDPAWDKLLQNLTMEELMRVGDCFHWRHAVPSVNAPGSRDENGPQGLTVSLFGGGLVTTEGKSAEATAFTAEDVMTAYTRWGTTWSGYNQNLMSGILRGEWGNKAMYIIMTVRTAVIVCGVLTLVFVALWIMGAQKLRKTEEYAAFKAAKAAYKASKKK